MYFWTVLYFWTSQYGVLLCTFEHHNTAYFCVLLNITIRRTFVYFWTSQYGVLLCTFEHHNTYFWTSQYGVLLCTFEHHNTALMLPPPFYYTSMGHSPIFSYILQEKIKLQAFSYCRALSWLKKVEAMHFFGCMELRLLLTKAYWDFY